MQEASECCWLLLLLFASSEHTLAQLCHIACLAAECESGVQIYEIVGFLFIFRRCSKAAKWTKATRVSDTKVKAHIKTKAENAI